MLRSITTIAIFLGVGDLLPSSSFAFSHFQLILFFSFSQKKKKTRIAPTLYDPQG